MLAHENDSKTILPEMDLFDKKSFQSTINRSDMSSQKNIIEFQFTKISPERRKDLKRKNSGVSVSLNANNLEKIIVQEIQNNAVEDAGKRKDKFSTIIKKGGKEHKVTFKENFIDKVFIDSFKEFNKASEFKPAIHAKCSNCACVIY